MRVFIYDLNKYVYNVVLDSMYYLPFYFSHLVDTLEKQ